MGVDLIPPLTPAQRLKLARLVKAARAAEREWGECERIVETWAKGLDVRPVGRPGEKT